MVQSRMVRLHSLAPAHQLCNAQGALREKSRVVWQTQRLPLQPPLIQPLDAGEVEVRPVNVRLQHAADFIRMRPRRADVVDGNVFAEDRLNVRVRLLDGGENGSTWVRLNRTLDTAFRETSAVRQNQPGKQRCQTRDLFGIT